MKIEALQRRKSTQIHVGALSSAERATLISGNYSETVAIYLKSVMLERWTDGFYHPPSPCGQC